VKPKAFAKVIPREVHLNKVLPRRDYTPTPQITREYLLGLLKDATSRNTTYRIATKNKYFCELIKTGIKNLGANSWMYKEGKNRNLWIVEFSKRLLNNVKVRSRNSKIAFVRGYFDAEGGIAREPQVRFYIYFCQKDYEDLKTIKDYLTEFGILSGKIHNPSKKVDPNYWRFYVSSKSYKDFALIVGSNHPEKSRILRVKI